MTITTEEAELLARLLDVFPIPASALRSLAAERDKAQGYLSRCLQTLYPNIEPLPDLLGVCTQIDNVLAGQQAEITLMLEALEKLARLGAEPHYGNSEGNAIALAAMRKAKNRALAAEIRKLIAAVENGAAQ
jgi:hypothetical protein